MNETTITPDSNVPLLNIGDSSYPIASLSDLGRAQISNMQIVEAELARLQNQIGIAQAAKASFIATLQSEAAKLDENLPD